MFPVITTTGQYTKGNAAYYIFSGAAGMAYLADTQWCINGNVRISSAAGAGATSNIGMFTASFAADFRIVGAPVATTLNMNIRNTSGSAPPFNTLQKIIISAPSGNDGTNFWGGVTEYSMVDKSPLSSGAGIVTFSWTVSNTSLPWQLKTGLGSNTNDIVVNFCY